MRGKTALILVNDPGFVTGDESLFRGKAMTYHGRWTYKFEEASRQGAAAAIIVHETAARVLRLGRGPEQLVRPAVLPRPRGRQCRAHRARRLDHRSACAPADGARRPGFRRAEIGGGQARLQAGAARRHRDGGRAQRDPAQALAERRRPDARQGSPGRVRHLHGALGSPRGRRRLRGRPHLQRRGGQCDRRRRHPDDRAGVPGHAARARRAPCCSWPSRPRNRDCSAPSTTRSIPWCRSRKPRP